MVETSETSAPSGTKWWRASNYELVGGTHIVPSSDAEIEVYDPLTEHELYWGGKRGDENVLPYMELFEVEPGDPESLIDWCRRWGLLGILPHQTLEACFWPTWVAGSHRVGGGGVGLGAHAGGAIETCYPRQVRYQRYRGVTAPKYSFLHRRDAIPDTPLEEEDLARAQGTDLQPQVPLSRPHTRTTQPWDGAIQDRGIVEGYAVFFPRRAGVLDWYIHSAGARLRHQTEPDSRMNQGEAEEIEQDLMKRSYPLPFSDEFLREYGEPIHEMEEHIRQLHGILEFWEKAEKPEGRDHLEGLLKPPRRPTPQGLPAAFQAALQPIHPSACLEDSRSKVRWSRTWESPSLYGTLNLMILKDFPLGDAHLRHCGKCDRVFATNQYNRKYCSPQCQKAAEMARYRARQQEEES